MITAPRRKALGAMVVIRREGTSEGTSQPHCREDSEKNERLGQKYGAQKEVAAGVFLNGIQNPRVRFRPGRV